MVLPNPDWENTLSVPLVQKYMCSDLDCWKRYRTFNQQQEANAGKVKTWKKSHNSTQLFQTKVCTMTTFICTVYIHIYVHTHFYVYVASCLLVPALCNCSLTLPALEKGRAPLVSFSHLQNYYLGNQFWHFGQIPFPQHNPAASTHSVLMHFYPVPTFLYWSQTQSLWQWAYIFSL